MLHPMGCRESASCLQLTCPLSLVQYDGVHGPAGTGDLRVAAGLFSAAALGSNVNIQFEGSGAAVTLLSALANRLTGAGS